MNDPINILWEKIFKTLDLYYCFYNKFDSDEWKNDENRKELLQTSKIIEDTFINPHEILKKNIKVYNKNTKIINKNNKEINISGIYILFDINLYNVFITLYNIKASKDCLLCINEMYFSKLIAFFGKLIIKKQFIENNNIYFELYNLENNKDEIYTISYDKKNGYFYKYR